MTPAERTSSWGKAWSPPRPSSRRSTSWSRRPSGLCVCGGQARRAFSLCTWLACTTRLQAIEATTGECIVAALAQLDTPYDAAVRRTCLRQLEVVTTDEASSNYRAERAMALRSPHRALLHLACLVHNAARVASSTFALLKPLGSRLIRLSLSMSGGARLNILRELRLILQEQLVIIHGGAPSSDATTHRNAVYNLFLDGQAPRDRFRRAVVAGLWNGDLRARGRVEHYESGCCESPSHTLQLMCNIGLKCLMPAQRCRTLQRNNWTGANHSIDDVALPSHAHGLFPLAYLRACPQKDDVHPTEKRDGLPGPPAELAEAGGEGDPARLLDAPITLGEDAEASRGADANSLEDPWSEDVVSRINSSRGWLRSVSFLDEVSFARIHHTPIAAMILRQLHVSGEQWERAEQKRLLDTGHRTYQLVWAHLGQNAETLLRHATDLLVSSSCWHAVSAKTEAAQLMCFKLAARMGAATYKNLYHRCRHWPYRLFCVLAQPEREVDIQTAPECTLDSYTASFRKHYGVPLSESARAELYAVAAVAGSDTASTERSHSRQQRRARFRVWTHCQDLQTLSAWSLSSQIRTWSSISAPEATAAKARSARGLAATTEHARRAAGRRSGGGGAWRMFVYVNAAGHKPDGAFIRELSERFRSLLPDEKEYYISLGELARQQHRAGQRSFGPRVRARILPRGSADAEVARALEHACDLGPRGPQSALVAISRVVSEASALYEDAKSDEHFQKAREREIQNRLVAWSEAHTTSTCSSWGIPSSSTLATCSVAHGQPAIRARICGEALTEAVSSAGTFPVQQLANEWCDSHRLILSRDCQPLGRVPVTQRPCFDAQRCVCSGDGLLLALLAKRFRAADRTSEKLIPNFKDMRGGGDLVYLFSVQSERAEGEVSECTVWLHLSFDHRKPVFLVFLELVRDEFGDRDGMLGLKVSDRRPLEGVAPWRTMWEVL